MTVNPIEKTLLYSLLRADFKSFVIKVFNEVSANSTYLDNWHIDVICHELMDTFEGRQNRLIINIPPRYMKSIICSVAFPAFILGHNPKATIIAVSYSEELASKLALDCKKVIESSWYQDVFPGTKLSKNKKSTNDFEMTKGGGRYATSVNGTLTGRGADYIIIDDPIKPMDAFSDLMREKTNDWYGSTLYSRLNNKNEGKIIVIMQRLHHEDFTGYLLETDSSFKHIKMPAISEEDEIWTVKNRITKDEKAFKRAKNEPLHHKREDITRLYQSKEYMGEFNFAGQYQQNPMPREGGIIKKKWFKFYNEEQLWKSIKKNEIKVNCIIQSWDTASKIAEHNDYSVCITVLRDCSGNSYILECYREKLEFPALIRKIAQKHDLAKEKYKNRIIVLIEEQASGTSLIQELKHKNRIYPIGIKPEYDKESRLISVSHLIENGTCLFPDNYPHWWLDFEKELLTFPRSKHDDQCDALSQALSHKLRTPLENPADWIFGV
ncbi:MAG: phage terminase large subunit [Candidatus Gastranaerophilales bacterium]|nr:phage terminase large subunit [Candidatus Gastranaerophilales bacterium]